MADKTIHAVHILGIIMPILGGLFIAGIKKWVKDHGPFIVAIILWAILITCIITVWIIAPPTTNAEPLIPQPEVVYKTHTVYVEVPLADNNNSPEPYYETVAETMTEDERELLAKIIYLEAGNQSITGQRAVAEVVFNRMLDDRFPQTLSEVIFAPGQFTTAAYINSAKPNEEQYTAISMTLEETTPILPSGVVYFATYVANGTLYERIGGHYFCY